MADILDALKAYKNMLDIEYEFILGRKNKSVKLVIEFQKKHFFHIAGLQHLKDLPRLSYSAELIFSSIENGKISCSYIESSKNYTSIKRRIEYLPRLEDIFDSNKTIFKYNPALQAFSVIEADFLMKNTMGTEALFTFLSKDKNGKYICRSFFPDKRKDYAERQTNWTVLYKLKRHKITGSQEVLFKYKNFESEC